MIGGFRRGVTWQQLSSRPVVPCQRQAWFDDGYLFVAPSDFTSNLRESSRYVKEHIVDNCHEFKIGITENPWRRWFKEGWYRDQGWEKMTMLYAAKSSKPRVCDSSGAMEIALIKALGDEVTCINKMKGGDCPSNGSPHFTYVVKR